MSDKAIRVLTAQTVLLVAAIAAVVSKALARTILDPDRPYRPIRWK